MIAGDVDWHFEWQEWAEDSLRIKTVLIEKSMCTGREILCDLRTVGQKTNSRLNLTVLSACPFMPVYKIKIEIPVPL